MTSTGLLLDTCAAIWSTQPEELRPKARDLMNEAMQADLLFVSPVTAWEIGLLTARDRIALRHEPSAWFGRLLKAGARLAPLTPEILIASSFLPDAKLRDPADRILAATARDQDWRLMTRDRPLLDYAEAGWMRAVRC